jgi:hypothetical protein
MRKSIIVAMWVGAWFGFTALGTAGDVKDVKKGKVEIYDDCDPTDEAWNATGGCTLEGGKVTEAEFSALLFSPLGDGTVIGHPAWRMEPSYLRLKLAGTFSAENEGGRTHTFTEVANFGGGFVDELNGPLLEPAPECATATPLAPGEEQEFEDLSPGNHLFQCCIHPWMRFLVKINAGEAEESTSEHLGHR